MFGGRNAIVRATARGGDLSTNTRVLTVDQRVPTNIQQTWNWVTFCDPATQ